MTSFQSQICSASSNKHDIDVLLSWFSERTGVLPCMLLSVVVWLNWAGWCCRAAVLLLVVVLLLLLLLVVVLMVVVLRWWMLRPGGSAVGVALCLESISCSSGLRRHGPAGRGRKTSGGGDQGTRDD